MALMQPDRCYERQQWIALPSSSSTDSDSHDCDDDDSCIEMIMALRGAAPYPLQSTHF